MIYFVSFILSFVAVAAYRCHALRNNILDIPNQRSSHELPVPRGGGVGIVFSVILVLPFCNLDTVFLSGLTVSLLLVAGVGYFDDIKSASALFRLALHVSAATIYLTFLGGFPQLDVLGVSVQSFVLLNAFGVLFLVWMLNLYNFMDGIDGIASIETLTVAFGGTLILCMRDGDPSVVNALLVVICATLGFLFWNFPKARIFMGDSGSSFIGFLLGGITIYTEVISPGMIWVWLILLGVFVVDATVTLMVRVKRGDKFYEAHRTHAYQNAAQLVRSHVPVTLAVAAINIVFLLPMAAIVGIGWVSGPLVLVFAYVPLCAVSVWLRAGRTLQ